MKLLRKYQAYVIRTNLSKRVDKTIAEIERGEKCLEDLEASKLPALATMPHIVAVKQSLDSMKTLRNDLMKELIDVS